VTTSPSDGYSHLFINLDDGYCLSCIMSLASTLTEREGILVVIFRSAFNDVLVEFDVNKINHDAIRKLVRSSLVENDCGLHWAVWRPTGSRDCFDYVKTSGIFQN
jgi:allophanate hydrolase subunit 1